MSKKELYLSPQADVLDLSYADPVCQAASGDIPVSGNIPDFIDDTYTPIWS